MKLEKEYAQMIGVDQRPVLSLPPSGQPAVEGKFLRVGTHRFWAKGVTYGSFAPNADGEPFPPMHQLRDDFAQMRDAGINTVRLYSPPSLRIADAAADAGLMIVPDICWGMRTCELDYPDVLKKMRDYVGEHARKLGNHPATLMLSIGNEIPPLIVRWYGRERIEAHLRELWDVAKSQAPNALITYSNHPPTEYLNLPFLDVVSCNVYLERERDFRQYLARLQTLAGHRPLFLSEIGLDSTAHGEAAQSEFIEWQLRAVFEKGLCGAAVYSWTDQWSIFQHNIQGWTFGLTDAARRPKPALDTVRRVYRGGLYKLRAKPWPRVSVVVASYNGGRTLDECLSALDRLNYPNHEVIVIDDGSTDDTRSIVARHPVRAIHVPNGGLSRARNLGIEAAIGEIVAFIDSDANADPDWLFYLVTALEEQDAAAVGGPNLSPEGDGFIAQCVDHAPGNPTHVLLGNELAEHVPGCNMAFRKSALEGIGFFDPTHRAAGDDVDVCWKLLARDRRIAFSPAALVWHHRRPTVKAFLRQQRGYGFAEAHLQVRYPGRFNIFGDLVWRGAVYDTPSHLLRREGLPSLFKPRVYQGVFCSGQFQAIYHPFLNWWFQVFTTAEWQLLSWCVLLSGVLALGFSAAAAIGLLACGGSMFIATVASAMIPALQAVRLHNWSGAARSKGFAIITLLHMLQPLARASGFVRGWWRVRHERGRVEEEACVWGNLGDRQRWLEKMFEHLRACGWIGQPSSEWDEDDIDVLGPGPYVIRLRSVYEDDLPRGAHRLRFRASSKMKRVVPLLWSLLLTMLPAFALFPYLLPLLAPVLIVMFCLARARTSMTQAIMALATEVAQAMDLGQVEATIWKPPPSAPMRRAKAAKPALRPAAPLPAAAMSGPRDLEAPTATDGAGPEPVVTSA